MPPPSLFNDSVSAIWNDLIPAPVYYSFSETLPGFYMILLITLIHYILNNIVDAQASTFANRKARVVSKPAGLSDELLHKFLSEKSKAKALKMIQKHKENASQSDLLELIAFYEYKRSFNKNVSKYKEAIFKVIVFGFVYFDGLYLIYSDGNDFFWDQQKMWNSSCATDEGVMPQKFSDAMRFWYSLQLGYHGHRALYQFFEHSRRDAMAMCVHHWITAMLLWGSWTLGYQQIGATVLLCNDNVDLLMPLAKLCEYQGYSKMNLFFTILFVVAWIPLRIGFYGYKVIYSVFVDGYVCVRPHMACWLSCVGLTVIYFLQFYWTKFLLQMLYRKLFFGHKVKDTRSDDDVQMKKDK